MLAGRPKDLEDVRSLLRLDLDEIDHRLIRKRLDELEKVIDDSKLIECFEQQVAASTV